MGVILSFLGGVPGKVWVYAGLVLAALVLMHQYGVSRETAGEEKVRAEWEQALRKQMVATASAQDSLNSGALKVEANTAQTVGVIEKIVADSTKAIEASKGDENKIYAAAVAATRRVRLASGLAVSDLPGATNPA